MANNAALLLMAIANIDLALEGGLLQVWSCSYAVDAARRRVQTAAAVKRVCECLAPASITKVVPLMLWLCPCGCGCVLT